MLDNILGPEDFPPKELLSDLRTLCALSSDGATTLSAALAGILHVEADRRDTHAAVKCLRTLDLQPDAIESVLKVSIFLHRQWARRRLTRAQVLSDLRRLGITDTQLVNIRPILDTIEQRLSGYPRISGRRLVLGSGTPNIESVTCVIEARAVFRAETSPQEEEITQDYYAVDHLVPTVLLEIISSLNEERRTYAFLLTEKSVGEFIDILDRARRRLGALKEVLPNHLTDHGVQE